MFRSRAAVRRCLVASASIALIASASAAGKGKDAGPWEVPARAARKANPIPADRKSLEAGKKVWVAECVDCHGGRGAGDGPGARDLKTPVPSLATAPVWRQTDGALFYKLSKGRGDMPGFDDMLSEEERWHVLNYARATLAPRGVTAAPAPGGTNPGEGPDSRGGGKERVAGGKEKGK